jgi:hypothetical protein
LTYTKKKANIYKGDEVFFTSDRGIDETRVQRPKLFVPQPHLIQLAGYIILNQDITLLDQVMDQVAALWGSDVDGDGFLVPVDA